MKRCGRSRWTPYDPNTLYASTNGEGVFKSRNGGAAWSLSWDQVNPSYIRPRAIDPSGSSTIYAGYGDRLGMIKTVNGGACWSSINVGLDSRFIRSIVIDPNNTNIVYVSGFNGFTGVYKSFNGGASWSDFSAGLTNNYGWALTMDPYDAQTLYVGTLDGVFKTTNGGQNWVFTGLRGEFVYTLAIDPNDPNTIYAGTSSNGVYKSTNGGRTWFDGGLTGLDIYSLTIDPNDSNTIYAGSRTRGALKSTDGANTWFDIWSLSRLMANLHPLSIEAPIYRRARGEHRNAARALSKKSASSRGRGNHLRRYCGGRTGRLRRNSYRTVLRAGGQWDGKPPRGTRSGDRSRSWPHPAGRPSAHRCGGGVLEKFLPSIYILISLMGILCSLL